MLFPFTNLLATSQSTNTEPRVVATGAAKPRTTMAAEVLSYVWHIVFMQQDDPTRPGAEYGAYGGGGVDMELLHSLVCPHTDEGCWRLRERCHLKDRTRPYCLPPSFGLPDDWAARHS